MNGRLVSRIELSAGRRDAMYALFLSQFPDVPPEVFEHDLEGKNWVLLLEGDSGALEGFTTIYYGRSSFRGCRVQVVVSGDTVIAEASAGSTALSKSWIGAINRLRVADGTPLYWLLIVSGYRTYRFLPVFVRVFYPRYDAPTPTCAKALMSHLAAERFGSCYDRATGIVRFPNPQRLKDGLRGIPEHRLADPHVAFFAERNPGHEAGDELVCLAEIHPGNLTPAGLRMAEAGGRILTTSGAVP